MLFLYFPQPFPNSSIEATSQPLPHLRYPKQPSKSYKAYFAGQPDTIAPITTDIVLDTMRGAMAYNATIVASFQEYIKNYMPIFDKNFSLSFHCH
ncbi:hypothetical protein [Parasediminibacterium sp. JCM 36343]|uniref:hypothetical protein n=1 Tax=Parasediminibacterium sp. JCM 36343 TaxID=3374279 RepID=UPI00397D616C